MSLPGINMKDVETAFEVSLRIAEARRHHAIGQSLLLPPAEDVTTSVLRKEVAKQLELIPLSNNITS
jgi:hypothetical protein